jgi:ATP-dependent Clp protease ATP-binding subunit ClpB
MIRQLDETKTSPKGDELALKFKNRIVGQPKAFEALSRVLEKYHSGIYDRKRPIASLLFLGPTGVGKTGSVEAFVEGLFGDVRKLMKVDCAEFQHSHEIAKLQGSPPGYLGHRETHPFFTNKSIREGFCTYTKTVGGDVESGQIDPAFRVILFDEIEKANDSLWNLLLGILDRGTMTTGMNEVVDFSPTVIIMTSNVGSAELAVKAGNAGLGFVRPDGTEFDYDTMKGVALSAARHKFTPEFLNRLDDSIVFRSLTPEDLAPILKIELDKLRSQIVLTSRTLFDLAVAPAALAQITAEGYDKRYNARNLRRVLEKYVSFPLARLVGTKQIWDNDIVVVDYVEGVWKYFAKTETKSSDSQPGLSKRWVPLSTLPKPDGTPPPPRSLSQSDGWARFDEFNKPLLEVSPTGTRRGDLDRSRT